MGGGGGLDKTAADDELARTPWTSKPGYAADVGVTTGGIWATSVELILEFSGIRSFGVDGGRGGRLSVR